MSDTSQPSQHHTSGTPRWVKVLLIGSLSLNLLIVGAVLGAVVTGAGKWRAPNGSGGPGALTQALADKDQRALKRQMVRAFAGEFDSRRQYRDTMAGFITNLRADVFDADAARASLTQIQNHVKRRFEVGQSLLVERLDEMTAEERMSYAERLEDRMRRKLR